MGFQIKKGVLLKYKEEPGVTEITIPANVREIRKEAFFWCKHLTEIHLPEGLRVIGEEAFLECRSLKRLVIPKGVTRIGRNACFVTEEIIVADENQCFASLDGVLYDKQFKTLLQCPINREKLIVPETVTTIMSTAFYECRKLTEVILPEGLKRIGDRAFYGCRGLTEMTIPANVSKIREYPFINCYDLREIVVAPGNPFFTAEQGVLYSKNGTHIVHFPLYWRHVVLRNTAAEFPLGLDAGFCSSLEYKGFVFRCDRSEMRFLLDAVVNKGLKRFADRAPERVQYEALRGLHQIEPERWEEICEKVHGKLRRLLHWLVDHNMQAEAEELFALGCIDLREEFEELVLYTNEKGRYEFQLMLVNYMHEHGGYDPDDFSL